MFLLVVQGFAIRALGSKLSHKMLAVLFLEIVQVKGSGPSAALALAIFDRALPVTRPLWAPYLACPCPLAFCDLDNKAMLEHAVVSTLLSLYAASPGLATAKPCVLCMAVARGCAARACGPVVKF
jgi:hypothetical protein